MQILGDSYFYDLDSSYYKQCMEAIENHMEKVYRAKSRLC